MSAKQQNTWAFQDPDSSPCSLFCAPQTLQTYWQSYQSLVFPCNSLSTFNNLWTAFYSTHHVGSDGDLLLLLTFCRNVLLVLSACSAAARLLALCMSTSLRQCRSECMKSFFVSIMFLYTPPVLGLLQFTQTQKGAFAIWCFDLTTDFQLGMLNLLAFFLPVISNAEEEAASRALVSCACNFLFLPNVSHLYN